jgi:hypothetical protein
MGGGGQTAPSRAQEGFEGISERAPRRARTSSSEQKPVLLFFGRSASQPRLPGHDSEGRNAWLLEVSNEP